MFLIIALEVVKKYEISTKYSHLDSTSLHLHGEYNNRPDNQEKELEIIRENPIFITHGYSRDHRPDLKQCILDLIVSSDGDIPLFFRGGSGNESDKALFGKILVEYSKQINFESIMVADSALYSENNLKLMENIKWISRVPLSIKKAKNLVKLFFSTKLNRSEIEGYTYQQEKVTKKRVWGVGFRVWGIEIKNFSSEFKAQFKKKNCIETRSARYKASLFQSHVFKRGFPTPYPLSPTPSELWRNRAKMVISRK